MATAWTNRLTPGQEIVIVLKNGEGSYMADDDTLTMLRRSVVPATWRST